MDEVANIIVNTRRIVSHYIYAEPHEHEYGNRCERESSKQCRSLRDGRRNLLSGTLPG